MYNRVARQQPSSAFIGTQKTNKQKQSETGTVCDAANLLEHSTWSTHPNRNTRTIRAKEGALIERRGREGSNWRRYGLPAAVIDTSNRPVGDTTHHQSEISKKKGDCSLCSVHLLPSVLSPTRIGISPAGVCCLDCSFPPPPPPHPFFFRSEHAN